MPARADPPCSRTFHNPERACRSLPLLLAQLTDPARADPSFDRYASRPAPASSSRLPALPRVPLASWPLPPSSSIAWWAPEVPSASLQASLRSSEAPSLRSSESPSLRVSLSPRLLHGRSAPACMSVVLNKNDDMLQNLYGTFKRKCMRIDWTQSPRYNKGAYGVGSLER